MPNDDRRKKYAKAQFDMETGNRPSKILVPSEIDKLLKENKELEEMLSTCQIESERRLQNMRDENKALWNNLSKENEPVTVRAKGQLEIAGEELGKLVDEKQKAYGDSITKIGKLLHIYLGHYRRGKEYIIPYEMIEHIGMMVRIIDKQNRIFSNPSGDLMKESPYTDIAGYALLGQELLGGQNDG